MQDNSSSLNCIQISASLTNLPQEVLDQICSFLPRPALRSLRITARYLQYAASRTLFETVFLKTHRQSFKKLRNISNHKSFYAYVKTIYYDDRIFDYGLADKTYLEWAKYTVGSHIGIPDSRKQEFLGQFTRRQMEEFYSEYKRWNAGQLYVLDIDNAKVIPGILEEALSKLTGLTNLEFDARPPRGNFFNTSVRFESLSYLGQKLLVEPDRTHGNELRAERFWGLLGAACQSGPTKLKNLYMSAVDVAKWNDCGNLHPNISLIGLESLSLQFNRRIRSHQGGNVQQVARLISNQAKLRELRISFEFLDLRRIMTNCIHLTEIFNADQHFRHLEKLSLRAIVTSEHDLRALLTRHSTTLRSLELSCIAFKSADILDQYGRGSWVCFIQFLSNSMTLDKVKFDGYFSNLLDEAWTTRDYDWSDEHVARIPATPYPNNCLKYRIERYITGSELCPFTPVTGTTPQREFQSMFPWDYKDDPSWIHDPHILKHWGF